MDQYDFLSDFRIGTFLKKNTPFSSLENVRVWKIRGESWDPLDRNAASGVSVHVNSKEKKRRVNKALKR
jgi:hypothetical protein